MLVVLVCVWHMILVAHNACRHVVFLMCVHECPVLYVCACYVHMYVCCIYVSMVCTCGPSIAYIFVCAACACSSYVMCVRGC